MSEATGNAFAAIGVRVDPLRDPVLTEFLPVIGRSGVDVPFPVVDVALEGDSLELYGECRILNNNDRTGHTHFFVVSLAFLKDIFHALGDKLEFTHIYKDTEPGGRGLQKDLGIIEPLLHFIDSYVAGETQLKPVPFFLNSIRNRSPLYTHVTSIGLSEEDRLFFRKEYDG